MCRRLGYPTGAWECVLDLEARTNSGSTTGVTRRRLTVSSPFGGGKEENTVAVICKIRDGVCYNMQDDLTALVVQQRNHKIRLQLVLKPISRLRIIWQDYDMSRIHSQLD